MLVQERLFCLARRRCRDRSAPGENAAMSDSPRLMTLAIPGHGLADRFRKIPHRPPAEQRAGLVDGERKQFGFVRRCCGRSRRSIGPASA